MDIIKIVFQWFLYSSKNPQNWSLTIKGLIPLLILFGIDQNILETFSNSVGEIIVATTEGLSALVTVYGLVRKIWLTYKNGV